MYKPPQHLYEFGPFQLDPGNHLLLRDGQAISLPPKAFDTLLLLVQRRGVLLEREELLKTVWPDTFVEENNLTHYVSMLRKALGEDGNGSTYIETVPKLGYRFIGEVRETSNGEAETVYAKHTKTHIVVLEQEEQETNSDQENSVHAETIVHRRTGLSAHRWKWLGLLAGATLLVIAGVVAYIRRPMKLTERDTILLADFENSTGEEVFDVALKRALAVKLEESPFLSIVPDSRVRETLRFMGRSPDESLTPALAREVCQRRAGQVYLSGSIARLGSHYVIALEAARCTTGDVLSRVQVDATGKDQVLAGMGEAVSGLRQKLGESVKSLERFDTPIAEATTPSLEALKAFSIGEQLRAKGMQIEAIPFFEHALELDSNFAMADNRLAALYLGIGEPDRSSQYSKKAFEFRQRGTERERLILSAAYYYQGIGDFDKAIAQYEVWKQSYPRDFIPHTNLAALYNDAGQFELALEEGREGLRLSGGHALSYNTTGWAAMRSGRVPDAKGIFEKAIADKFDNSMMHRGLFAVAFLNGDNEAMEHEAGLTRGKPDEFRTVVFEAQAAAYLGKLRTSRELYQHAAILAEKNHFADAAAAITAGHSLIEANCGNANLAVGEAKKALTIAQGRDALGMSAAVFAIEGDAALAEESVVRLKKYYPSDTLVNAVAAPTAQAAIEIRRKHADHAVNLLEGARHYEFGPMVFGQGYLAPYLRAQAYMSAGKSAEAAMEFQRILDNRAAAPFAPLQALAHLGLARALVSSGDRKGGLHAYEEFFSLWKGADSDIPLLRRAREEYTKVKND